MKCPRKYSYVYGGAQPGAQGLKGLDAAGLPALWSRELIHPILLELYLSTSGMASEKTWEAAKKLYQEQAGVAGQFDSLYSIATAEHLINDYFKGQFVLDKDQYEFIPSDPLLGFEHWIGVMDTPLLREKETGDLWILDFKCSKYPPRQYTEPIGQLVGYAALTRARGILLSHFQLSSTKSGKSKVEHTRYTIPTGPDHHEEWLTETNQTIAFIEHCKTTHIWPKNSDACYSYGQPCVFLDACRAGKLAGGILQRWQEALERRAQEQEQEQQSPTSVGQTAGEEKGGEI